MSANQYRGQLDRKRKQRLDAEKKAGEARAKESKKRAEAAKARQLAAKASNATTARSRMNEANRREDEAKAAGNEASRWAARSAGYAKEEASISSRLSRAEQSEAAAAEKARQREQQALARRSAADQNALSARLLQNEASIQELGRRLPEPKPEKLRILMLGASADGGLRVGREQKRIRTAIESALHRDHVELDVRPAATTEDLLDGLAKFRPHVIHFSGHSNEDLIEFEDEADELHEGVIVTAQAFANAIQATDDPPLLIVLNSCHSAGQLQRLVDEVAPFAIGMADEIDDTDAITYATRFYANIANGQSIDAAHRAGRAALELGGLDGADLPTLSSADDVDPAAAILVKPA
ncbi:CHAT domain-containing protein [Microbacterium sp. B35-30]|uniref:CHAT domain-containing protein n=1 Tax=Microbacterium sp. B35-30 TaxID=1962642 RepID=UPI0013D8571F|nr:CHAT domain-containing protein [Microbacterium sp. B35-30]KAF2417603.1 hypothetical protein B2K11_11770 [Microbacterium sp. B35-30]